MIFKNLTIWPYIIHILKYQRSKISGFNDFRYSKFKTLLAHIWHWVSSMGTNVQINILGTGTSINRKNYSQQFLKLASTNSIINFLSSWIKRYEQLNKITLPIRSIFDIQCKLWFQTYLDFGKRTFLLCPSEIWNFGDWSQY